MFVTRVAVVEPGCPDAEFPSVPEAAKAGHFRGAILFPLEPVVSHPLHHRFRNPTRGGAYAQELGVTSRTVEEKTQRVGHDARAA